MDPIQRCRNSADATKSAILLALKWSNNFFTLAFSALRYTPPPHTQVHSWYSAVPAGAICSCCFQLFCKENRGRGWAEMQCVCLWTQHGLGEHPQGCHFSTQLADGVLAGNKQQSVPAGVSKRGKGPLSAILLPRTVTYNIVFVFTNTQHWSLGPCVTDLRVMLTEVIH